MWRKVVDSGERLFRGQFPRLGVCGPGQTQIMNTLRLLSLVLAATALILLVSGTLGFDTTTADRELEVETVPDDEAYVGYEQAPKDIFFGKFDDTIITYSGKRVPLVEVTNRFTSSFDVTNVAADTERISIQHADEPTGVGPGESATIEGETRCDDAFLVTKEYVGVSVTVEATDTRAELDGDAVQRKAKIICFNIPFKKFKHHVKTGTGAHSNGVGTQSTGVGPASQSTGNVAGGDQLRATVWLEDTQNGTVERVPGTWDNTERIRSLNPSLGDGVRVVAVELDDLGVAFAAPGWNQRKARSTGGGFDVGPYLDDPSLRPFDPHR
jgi:hypothetical protein